MNKNYLVSKYYFVAAQNLTQVKTAREKVEIAGFSVRPRWLTSQFRSVMTTMTTMMILVMVMVMVMKTAKTMMMVVKRRMWIRS